ncbi:MAG: preprotein translocase subunit YajC [Ruminococcaceae bacterium]|nr:preprotein translocase subunit YajC [Oscillospiraceae bacterium]
MGSTMVMLVLMLALMYFMLIRPENKRKKEAEEMRAALKSGDNVTTIGGITGTVVDVKEDKFVLETGADRVRIEFAKFALSENHTAAARAQADAKKAKEQAAKDKAARKADK